MPTFSYTARDKTGKLIVGQKNARSEMELVDRLRALGQYLVSSKLISKEGEGVAKKKITVVSQKPKIPPRDVLQFTSDFSAECRYSRFERINQPKRRYC